MRVFDSHFHIIDSAFPLVPSQGYLPDEYTHQHYLADTKPYELVGGAVVSGSFQQFDQGYLVHALEQLGSGFVGVTQLPHTVSDGELSRLHQCGVRALRFNVNRGGSEDLEHLHAFAMRVYEMLGWHVELYIHAKQLAPIKDTLLKLPAVSIDHLGLGKEGFRDLLDLVESGVKVKATGFGRVDFDVAQALKDIVSANPNALMFGTDLPCTRAPRPYCHEDFQLVMDAFDEATAEKIFYKNACEFYGVSP